MGLGHLHIVTLYESLIFIAWAIVLGYIIVEFKYKSKAIGGFVIPVAAILMIYASMFPNVDSNIAPVPEVLRGNFYNYHVIPCFFAYAAFTVSFGASIIYLFKQRTEPMGNSPDSFWSFFPSVNTLDTIIYKSIAVGFIFFTIQMVAGMFRTKVIWDSYWEWDPTQVLGLMTWLIYSTILHGRYRQWWGGSKTAIFSIIGFLTSAIGFAAATGRMVTTGHYPIL
jgi:cytochrome c-type biogenesis protein CcsB